MQPIRLNNRTLIITEGTPPKEWDQLLVNVGGNFYHSSAFSEINSRYGSTPIYFQYIDSGNIIGLALGFIRSQWSRWPAKQLFKSFEWQTHPKVVNNDHEVLNEFSDLIIKYVEKLGLIKVFLHSENSETSPDFQSKSDFNISQRLEYTVPLSIDPNDVMGRISSRKRTYLRSAIKDTSIIVREAFTKEAIAQLIEFQQVSRERRRKRGEDYSVANLSATEQIFNDYVKPGFGRLFISYQNHVPLSGILLHCWGKNAYYTMAGSSELGFTVNAPMITVWGAIVQLCQDGYSEINLGGVNASASDPSNISHGLYRFKRSFGGTERLCLTYEKEIHGFRRILHNKIQ